MYTLEIWFFGCNVASQLHTIGNPENPNYTYDDYYHNRFIVRATADRWEKFFKTMDAEVEVVDTRLHKDAAFSEYNYIRQDQHGFEPEPNTT